MLRPLSSSFSCPSSLSALSSIYKSRLSTQLHRTLTSIPSTSATFSSHSRVQSHTRIQPASISRSLSLTSSLSALRPRVPCQFRVQPFSSVTTPTSISSLTSPSSFTSDPLPNATSNANSNSGSNSNSSNDHHSNTNANTNTNTHKSSHFFAFFGEFGTQLILVLQMLGLIHFVRTYLPGGEVVASIGPSMQPTFNVSGDVLWVRNSTSWLGKSLTLMSPEEETTDSTAHSLPVASYSHSDSDSPPAAFSQALEQWEQHYFPYQPDCLDTKAFPAAADANADIRTHCGGLNRGEIVVVTSPQNPKQKLCKRIIGLPGDLIRVLSDTSPLPVSNPHRWVVIPPGHIWVQGDNLYNSADSRSFGYVPVSLVTGKVVMALYPLKQMGRVKTTLEHHGGALVKTREQRMAEAKGRAKMNGTTSDPYSSPSPSPFLPQPFGTGQYVPSVHHPAQPSFIQFNQTLRSPIVELIENDADLPSSSSPAPLSTPEIQPILPSLPGDIAEAISHSPIAIPTPEPIAITEHTTPTARTLTTPTGTITIEKFQVAKKNGKTEL